MFDSDRKIGAIAELGQYISAGRLFFFSPVLSTTQNGGL